MKAIYKVQGGKLIKVDLTLENNKIKKINITGDFFCHPEEKFEQIEKRLKDTTFEKGFILKKINEVVHQHQLTLVGVSSQDLAETISQAK